MNILERETKEQWRTVAQFDVDGIFFLLVSQCFGNVRPIPVSRKRRDRTRITSRGEKSPFYGTIYASMRYELIHSIVTTLFSSLHRE